MRSQFVGLVGGLTLVGVAVGQPTDAVKLPPGLNWVPMTTMVDPVPWVDPTLVHVGVAESQGSLTRGQAPGSVRAGEARSLFGIDGSGITVGIISDSFNALGGEAVGIASGDLPGPGNPLGNTTPVEVLRDDLGPNSIDEGRAMAEIIHDLAPGAALKFHSAFNNDPNEATIAVAIDALVAAGCDIIVDDVALLTDPFFQDGLTARAADRAAAAGVAYFSSAGNAGDEAYIGSFVPLTLGVNTFHDFDADGNEGGDPALDVIVAAGTVARVVVQWDDPHPSVAAPPGASLRDFDVAVFDVNGDLVDISQGRQDLGADPVELVLLPNALDVDQAFGVFILPIGPIPPGAQLKATVIGPGVIADNDDTNSPTNFGQSAARGAQAVGATFYASTQVEPFSARGPTEIIFDRDGVRNAEVRPTPDFIATNGVDTTFFGSDRDGNGLPNFSGTSAASPHAAAVAALVLDEAGNRGFTLVPQGLYRLLQDTALDRAAPGPDPVAGAGLIDAVAALLALQPEPFALGDVNCDGFVDTFDIDPFIKALSGPERFDEVAPGCDIGLADLNEDGRIDTFDIMPLITALDEG